MESSMHHSHESSTEQDRGLGGTIPSPMLVRNSLRQNLGQGRGHYTPVPICSNVNREPYDRTNLPDMQARTFEEVNEQGGSAQQAASSADDRGTEDRDKRILQTQHVVNLDEMWDIIVVEGRRNVYGSDGSETLQYLVRVSDSVLKTAFFTSAWVHGQPLMELSSKASDLCNDLTWVCWRRQWVRETALPGHISTKSSRLPFEGV
ncbi:hypothetical protein KC357_g2123 [Hortaea werneckii]|nr:hypothetical protein KC357_g2123 [Hortaea werneckii]